MVPYVELQSVRYILPNGTAGLDDVTLALAPGEKVALLGANGSGKTTVALLLAGVLSPTTGYVRWNKIPEPAEVQLLMQNPSLQTLGTTVEEELRFGLDLQSTDRKLVANKIDKSIQSLALSGERELTKLSGGELQSVVGEALRLLSPKLLIYDEPAMYLSPSRRAVLLSDALLSNCGVLWITPQRAEANKFPRTVVLRDGKVVFNGASIDLPTDETTWAEWGLPSLSIEITAIAKSNSSSSERIELIDIEVKGEVRPRLTISALSINAGERIGIIGDNGAGKTTLLALLGSILKPDRGRIDKSSGFPLTSLSFQFQEQAFLTMNVREEIGGPDPVVSEKIASERLLKFGLEPEQFLHRDPYSLSGGEARRVALAATLHSEDTFLLWDEPTAALDPAGSLAIAKVLAQHPGGYAIAGHDHELLMTVCNRIIALKCGTILWDKPSSEVTSDDLSAI